MVGLFTRTERHATRPVPRLGHRTAESMRSYLTTASSVPSVPLSSDTLGVSEHDRKERGIRLGLAEKESWIVLQMF